MNTFLILFATKPAMTSEHFGKYAGANWTAWVVSKTPEDAMKRAVDYAAQRGWVFEGGRDVRLVERSHHVGDDELLERFDTAQRDRIAVIIDTFRVRIAETN